MKPHQIISLMTFDGADNTLALPDHNDHIHVGFHPLDGSDSKAGSSSNSVLKPEQWLKLIDRLGKIDNPTVMTTPSKYSLKVKAPADRLRRALRRLTGRGAPFRLRPARVPVGAGPGRRPLRAARPRG